MTSALRENTIAEARRWLGTPYHHGAAVLGAGVDCGGLLVAVYTKTILAKISQPKLLSDWYLHRAEEIYLNFLDQHCIEVDLPELADIVAVKFGRAFAHGGIVIRWPEEVIHANAMSNVEITNFGIGPIATRPMRFFSPKAFHE